MRETSPATPRLDGRLAVCLFAVEAAAVVSFLAAHRLGDRRFAEAYATVPGLAMIASVALLVAATVGVARRVRTRGPKDRGVRLTMALNALTVVSGFLALELVLRSIAVDGHDSPALGGLSLLPRSWEAAVERNRGLLEDLDHAVLVEHATLGWRPAAGRSSRDRLYHISAEGVRDREPGRRLRDVQATHRVAIVGDSFTFCNDVDFESSWGHQLERRLGIEYQVLNFGVSGYGVDQAYLRYMSEVRSWSPSVVIFAVFPHDLRRTMMVYPFIDFPSWEVPFSKPRFVLEDDRLLNLNPSIPNPWTIFEYDSIDDLPLVAYSPGYQAEDWRWRWFHASYLARFLVSRFPALRSPRVEVSDAAMRRINSAILVRFQEDCARTSSVPLFVFLPSRRDLTSQMNPHRTFMLESGLPLLNLTDAVRSVPPPDRFVSADGHYSATTNARIAEALAEPVRSAAGARK